MIFLGNGLIMIMVHNITRSTSYEMFILNLISSIVEENEQVYEEVYENRVL